ELGPACVGDMAMLTPAAQVRYVDDFSRNLRVLIPFDQYESWAERLSPTAARKLTAYAIRSYANLTSRPVEIEAVPLIAEAEEAGDALALAHLHYAVAVRTSRMGGSTEVMERHLQTSLDIVERNDLVILRPSTLNALAVRAKTDGEYEVAIARYNKAIDAYQAIDRLESIAVIEVNIGNVFADLGGSDEAIRFYRRGIERYERNPTDQANRIPGAYGNLAELLSNEGRYEEARTAIVAAKEANQRATSDRLTGFLDFTQAVILHELGDTETALRLADGAIENMTRYRDPVEIANVFVWLAERLLERDKLAQAARRLESAREIIEPDGRNPEKLIDREGNQAHIRNYAASTGQLLSRLGRAPEAVSYLNAALVLERENFNETKIEAALNGELLFNLRERERRLEEMEKEAELAGLKLRQSQLLTGLGFASAMIIALFAFYQYRSHRLQKSLATTRSLFLSEIHHRTKNNFQMLSSLLSLDARRAKANLTDGTGGNQTSARQDAANRARTMALVHGHLYDRGDPQTTEVDTRDFLVELLELLEDSLGRPQIMLSHDILQTRIDVDTATPLALLVCEIVTNAYKHAFDDNGGHISVRLIQLGDKLRLEIADDGRGFDPVAARQKRGSLGMHLIEDLADQVGGQLSRSGDNSGTRWTIDNIDRRLKSISRSTELQDEAA
ncbi:MAG: tetratricopeptide repeat protein, partial [Pseudomonadota bacterium]